MDRYRRRQRILRLAEEIFGIFVDSEVGYM